MTGTAEVISPTSYGWASPRVATPTPSGDLTMTDLVLGQLALVGHAPMPWQITAASHLFVTDPAGGWLCPEGALIVARQQGKTDLLAARILAETCWLRSRTLYTTHSLQAAKDLWKRLTDWVDATPSLRRRVAHRLNSNGREYLEFVGGGALQIATSSGKPPRGFDRVGLLIYDEAREMTSEDSTAALDPTQTAHPNPQRLIVSNAGTRASLMLNATRDAGRLAAARGDAAAPAWLEWSAPPGAATDDDVALCQANPAVGHTSSLDYLHRARTRPGMSETVYRTEHMCQWVDVLDVALEPMLWLTARLADVPPLPVRGAACLGVHVASDRSVGAIGAAWRIGPKVHVRLIEQRTGTAWMVDRTVELSRQLKAPIAFDRLGPGVDVGLELERRLMPKPTGLGAGDVAAAAIGFDADLTASVLTHTGQQPLDAAVAAATRTRLGGRWRFGYDGPVAALHAVMLAHALLAARPVLKARGRGTADEATRVPAGGDR